VSRQQLFARKSRSLDSIPPTQTALLLINLNPFNDFAFQNLFKSLDTKTIPGTDIITNDISSQQVHNHKEPTIILEVHLTSSHSYFFFRNQWHSCRAGHLGDHHVQKA